MAASSSLLQLCDGCWLGLRVSAGAQPVPRRRRAGSTWDGFPGSCTHSSGHSRLSVCPRGPWQGTGCGHSFGGCGLEGCWAGGFGRPCLSRHICCEDVTRRINCARAEKAPTPAETVRSRETGPFSLSFFFQTLFDSFFM